MQRSRSREWAEVEALVSSYALLEPDPHAFAPSEVCRGPRLGPAVTVTAFVSYACPYATIAEASVSASLARFPDVRLIRRHFVVPHRWRASLHAAELVEAARALGAGPEAHAWMLRQQRDLERVTAAELARVVEVGVGALEQEMQSSRPRLRVARDLWIARVLQVHAAPSYLIDGVEYEGLWNEEEFCAALAGRVAEMEESAVISRRSCPTMPHGLRSA